MYPAGRRHYGTMAKSIRSKVKKRMRTVKRGVVKRELKDQESKLGVRPKQVQSKLGEAGTGYIRPGAAAHRHPAMLLALIPTCAPQRPG